MSEYTMSKIPATPMDAIKQVYELFQDPTRFIRRDWAQNREHHFVAVNDKAAYCWCLSGAVFRVYNVDIAYKPYWSEELSNILNDTFKLIWEKIPPYSKIGISDIPFRNYIRSIALFNDEFGYTGVMRLLQAVVDDTEYVGVGIDPR